MASRYHDRPITLISIEKNTLHLSGLEKASALRTLSERYGCPWIEFDEEIIQPVPLLLKLDLEKLKEEGWFPHTLDEDRATIIACTPDPEMAVHAGKVLGVAEIEFLVTLPQDLIRIIEHNQDANPGFPACAGRTPLARVRTYLADRRSFLAHYRTLLAKSRTGLAFIRTGLSCITISLVFARIFGQGFLLIVDMPLLLIGGFLTFDGLKWYIPLRRNKARLPRCKATRPTGGTTVLSVTDEETFPQFRRCEEIPGSAPLRASWPSLTPIMRRRFLASDRTDYAEERTQLACYRSHMARVRTGLAFARTGFAFVSIGFAMVRYFHPGYWRALDLTLVVIGSAMILEGFLWYFRSRPAGVESYSSVRRAAGLPTIWDYFFPHRHFPPGHPLSSLTLPVGRSDLPGIWATTGLALERTVLAERRNVMARLRTIMSRARTGYAFIRTGISLTLIGIVFALYFDVHAMAWHVFNWSMIVGGLLLIGDGLYWSLPAERIRRQFPYCYGDMEITVPDYGVPARSWRRVVFSHE